jgi:hypothetical protein
VVFAPVEEQPAAGFVAAFMNVMTVRRREQVGGGVYHGPNRTVGRLRKITTNAGEVGLSPYDGVRDSLIREKAV